MHAFYGQRPGGRALAASEQFNQSQGGYASLKVNRVRSNRSQTAVK